MNVAFDFSVINDKVIGNITSCVDSINETKNCCVGLNIPSGFQYETFLRNLSSDLTSIASSLNNVSNFLRSANQDYTRLINDLNIAVNKIDSIMIDRYESIVR